jgi:hypothetical protein
MRIWKWDLRVTDWQTLMLPAGAKLLDVQVQGEGMVCLWALCEHTAPKEPRHIAIYGTGEPMPDDPGEYVATFQLDGGLCVFHVFEDKSRAA